MGKGEEGEREVYLHVLHWPVVEDGLGLVVPEGEVGRVERKLVNYGQKPIFCSFRSS